MSGEIGSQSQWWKKNIKGFLLDVYGVAYNCGEQSTLIEGSVEAIDKFVCQSMISTILLLSFAVLVKADVIN